MNIRVSSSPLSIPAQSGLRQYVPARGESLQDIANRFGISIADLQAANPGSLLPNFGMPLSLPQSAREGQTEALGMESIDAFAARHRVSVEQLLTYNGLDLRQVSLNTRLTVPPTAAVKTPSTAPSAVLDPSTLTPEQLRDAQTIEEGQQVLSDLKYLTSAFEAKGIFLGASGVNTLTIKRVDAAELALPKLEQAVVSKDPVLIRAALYDPAITELRSIEGSPRAIASLPSDVKAYAKHYQQLAWRMENLGRLGTPEQQQQAINNFTRSNPEWVAENRRLETAVVEQGKSLMQQISYLRTRPQDQADRQIQNLLADPNARMAINLAMRTEPQTLQTASGVRFMQSVANSAKLTDQTQKFAKEVGNLYLAGMVRSLSPEISSSNPGRVSLAEAQIARLQQGPTADLLGVNKDKFNRALDAMRESLPSKTDALDDVLAKQRNFNQLLETDDYRGAFSKDTSSGQQLRLLSLAFSAAGATNSWMKAGETGTTKDVMKALADSAGLMQKSHEIFAGRGVFFSSDQVYGAINSTVAGRICNVVSAAFDAWSAIDAFSGGDNFRGSMYALSATGTVLAASSGTTMAASWGVGASCGPVGIGLVALATAGLLYADYRDMTQFETPESKAFLQDLGMSPQAADAFIDQNWGASAVPALARFAELKGYDLTQPEQQQAFTEWVNTLSPNQLDDLCAKLHTFSQESGGNMNQMGNDTTVQVRTDRTPRPSINYARTGQTTQFDVVERTPRSVGEFDAYLLRSGATPISARAPH